MAVYLALVELCSSGRSVLGVLIMILLLIWIIWLLLNWIINRNKKQPKKSNWPKILIGSALVLALLYILLPAIIKSVIGETSNSLEPCSAPNVLPFCGKDYCTNRALNKTMNYSITHCDCIGNIRM